MVYFNSLEGQIHDAWGGGVPVVFLLLRCVVVPTQNAEGAQCIPAACAADTGLHLQRNIFGMKQVERPAAVLVAALYHDFDGLMDAAVGFDSCIPQIIESAQDVV